MFLAFYPQNDNIRCMKVERITKMSLVDCEGNVRARFAEARKRRQDQVREKYMFARSYEVGLVLLSIRHDGTSNYETVFPLYITVGA